ncbi:MAG: hypothetical protein ACRYFR_04760 [Janthinobacterium lividum]
MPHDFDTARHRPQRHDSEMDPKTARLAGVALAVVLGLLLLF